MYRYSCTLIAYFPSIFCLSFISEKNQNPALQIQLPDGLIQGRLKHTTDLSIPYHSFEGIPYAKPPVGDLRFRPPQPPEKWEGILNANGDVPICLQIPPYGYEDEDCLYLNVYVPKSQNENLKAVMVWIYGGGFLFGAATSDFYGADYLLERDVIVVDFNYRLNIFGFLSTGDLASPGNYGLKDQVAALQWIQKNIQFFGGDPNKVTIFGESAGAASVSYLIFSPKSRGLFQRAITQSGSAICPWALQTNPLSIARKMASSTGFIFGNTNQLVKYFKEMNTSALRNAAFNGVLADTFRREQGLTFSPVLEPEHDDAFITQSVLNLLKKGDFSPVPCIIGFNSKELAIAEKVLDFVKPVLNVLPNSILIPASLNNRNSKIGDEIREYYFKDPNSTKTEEYVELFSDTYFNRAVLETARIYSIYAPTYMYRFCYDGYFLGKKAFFMGEDRDIRGVSHAEEIWYLFSRRDLHHANETDKLIRERMVTFWTNFAKFGDPTPDDSLNTTWPKYEKKTNYPILNIDNKLTIQHGFQSDTMDFWRRLFKKYARPPFNTY